MKLVRSSSIEDGNCWDTLLEEAIATCEVVEDESASSRRNRVFLKSIFIPKVSE